MKTRIYNASLGAKAFTALMLFAAYTSMQAQDIETPERDRATVGVKAGINFANVWDEQGQDFRADGKLGFAGGLFIGIPIGEVFGFQPEFLISQKGFKGGGTLLGTGYSLSRTKTSFDIPLQLQIKPTKYITLLAGPQYSYMLQQKDVYTFGSNQIEQIKEFENENIRRNMLGFVAGVDVNINHLVVSARVGWDFLTNQGDGTSSTPRYRSQWLQFTVGYSI
jgi:hypothetical protein